MKIGRIEAKRFVSLPGALLLICFCDELAPGHVGVSQLRSRAAAVEEVNFAERAQRSDRQGVEVSSISVRSVCVMKI